MPEAQKRLYLIRMPGRRIGLCFWRLGACGWASPSRDLTCCPSRVHAGIVHAGMPSCWTVSGSFKFSSLFLSYRQLFSFTFAAVLNGALWKSRL